MSTTYYDRIVRENIIQLTGWAQSDLPSGVKWSGAMPIPNIGDRVHVAINDFGHGVVIGYFVEPEPENGWLGVKVLLDQRPAWHIKQNPDRPYCLVFGAELR